MKAILLIFYLAVLVIAVKISIPIIQNLPKISFQSLIFIFIQTSILLGLSVIGLAILLKSKK